jgi:cytochrome b561
MSDLSSPSATPKRRITSAFQRLMSLHWWMAALYAVLFVGGTYMSQLPREVSFRMALYDVHKSLGLVTLALLTWRILVLLQVWRKKYSRRWPKLTAGWWRNFWLHTTMYGLMWFVPVAGIFLSNSFRPNNVKIFGLPLPDIFPANQAMVDLGRGLHFWTAYSFLALIGLHMLLQWKVVRANTRRLRNFIQLRFQKQGT